MKTKVLFDGERECSLKSYIINCGAKFGGYVCTRKKGHLGCHHAHGEDKCLVIWKEK